jgi:hypothetical protein
VGKDGSDTLRADGWMKGIPVRAREEGSCSGTVDRGRERTTSTRYIEVSREQGPSLYVGFTSVKVARSSEEVEQIQVEVDGAHGLGWGREQVVERTVVIFADGASGRLVPRWSGS